MNMNMKKNGCREEHDNNSYCYFHPREAVIGVCPLCLNERLLVLASKQSHHKHSSSTSTSATYTNTKKIKPPISFHKIFDFGSLLHRLEFRPRKSDLHDDRDGYVSTSQEDSFISIKFEDNGMASWDKKHNNNNKVCSDNKVSLENYNKMSWNHQSLGKDQHPNNTQEEMTKSVIELGKPRGSSLRWRKQISHVFQLVRWKKSNKTGTVCHVGTKVEGVKVRKGWIRTLSKKRNMEME